MASWMPQVTDALWRSAVTVVPLALLAAAVCRWVPCRASTRHAIWLLVLAWFVVPTVLPATSPFTIATSDLDSPENQEVPQVCSATDTRQSRLDELGRDFAVPIRVVPDAFDAVCTEERFANEPCLKSNPFADAMKQAPTPPGTAARSEPIVPDRLEPAAAPAGRLSAPRDPAPMLEAPPPVDARVASTGFSASSESDGPGVKRDGDPVRPTGPSLETANSLTTPQARIREAVNETESIAAAATAVDRTPGTAAMLQRWAVGLLNVRDAIGGLPGIPTGLWLSGAGLFVVVTAFRSLRFVHRVRAGRPAPADVAEMVREAARRLGVRRVPETVMLDERISPMIWCGIRVRLVLPSELWAQLDHVGRQAVVYHELAHLRRFDHWIRWIELVVSGLYWWHPLVWWVRRRLHEEADLCCDAWVTWLLPRRRRAYAEALLVTKQYISGDHVTVPAVGMGVATVRAKRFARRLTMVMTQTVTPRLSVSGISMALALMLAGWLATPVRSCPPTPGETEPTPPVTPVEPVQPVVQFVPFPSPDAVAPLAAVGFAPDDTYKAHMASRSLTNLPAGIFALGQSNGSDEVEERLERLERQNEELQSRLDRLADALERMTGGVRRGGVGGPRADRPDRPTPPGRRDRPDRVPDPRRTVVPEGEVIARDYELPKDKLEKLCELMTRPDVPIPVRQHAGHIEVHATHSQHEAFKRFVDMIRSGWDDHSYQLPEGKLEAMFGLMALNDVPILVNREGDSIGVRATGPQHEIFLEFLRLVEPEASRRPGATIGSNPVLRPTGVPRADKKAKEDHNAAARVVQQARKLQDAAAHVAAMNDEIRALEHHADEMESRAEELEMHAEELADRAEEVEARAEETDDKDAAADLRAEARALKRQSKELRREAKKHMKEAEKTQRKASQLEDEIDRMQDRD